MWWSADNRCSSTTIEDIPVPEKSFNQTLPHFAINNPWSKNSAAVWLGNPQKLIFQMTYHTVNTALEYSFYSTISIKLGSESLYHITYMYITATIKCFQNIIAINFVAHITPLKLFSQAHRLRHEQKNSTIILVSFISAHKRNSMLLVSYYKPFV